MGNRFHVRRLQQRPTQGDKLTKYTTRGYPYPEPADKIAKTSSPEDSIREDFESLAKAVTVDVDSVDLEVSNKVDTTDRRLPYFAEMPGKLLVALDATGTETWIGANDTNGGPTPVAEWHVRELLGMLSREDPGYLFSFIDASFHRTDLSVSDDGQLAEFVVDRLAPRIASRIGGAGAGSGFATTDRYLDGGVQKRMFPDTSNIVVVGSSTLEFGTPYIEQAFSDTGATFHNWAKNGERGEHICARFGSIPALITVTGGSIPASGDVVVTSSNMPPSGSLKPFEGTLAGVPGTLSSSGSVITFTRTASGSSNSVPAGTAFIPDRTEELRNMVAIIELGKNNQTDVGAAALVNAMTDTTYAYLEPFVKRAMVLEQFVHSNQAVDSTQYVNVMATNADRLAKYGNQIIRVNEYICSPQVWIDTGITPTVEDLQMQADKIKPWSISSDAGHLNDAGYTALSNYIRAHANAANMY